MLPNTLTGESNTYNIQDRNLAQTDREVSQQQFNFQEHSIITNNDHSKALNPNDRLPHPLLDLNPGLLLLNKNPPGQPAPPNP